MIFLKILAAIVLFFAVLFSLNLKLDIAMYDTLTLRAGLGPVMLTLSPKKERKVNPDDFTYEKHQKRLEKDRKRALKKAEKKRLKDEQKVSQKEAAETAAENAENADKKKFSIRLIIDILEYVFRELPIFIGYFRTEIVALDVTVGGKDAAAIGKSYGIISQSVEYLLELLKYKTRMKKIRDGAIAVRADFLLEKTKFNIHIRLKLRLFSIIKVGCHTLAWFIKRKVREAKNAVIPSPKKDEQSAQ